MGWIGMFVGLLVIIAIHEGGHLWAAIRLGIPVNKVRVGVLTLFSFTYKNIPIHIGVIPFVGMVEIAGELDDYPLHKRFVMTLMGPVASVLGGLLLYFVIPSIFGVRGGVYISEAFAAFDGCNLNGFVLFSAIIERVFTSGGFISVVSLFGIWSVGLGLFNLLPIPPLDGGKLLEIGLEALVGKKVRNVSLAISLVVVLYFLWDMANSVVQIASAVVTPVQC
jgi:membrane-associated protease RseP (regulator of RpoE activity)